MRRPRATSIGTVLLLLAVLSLLVFTVAQSTVMHLFFSTEVTSRQHARNLAETAVARALNEVLENESFGVARQSGLAITVTGPLPGSLGYLSFHPGEAHGQSVAYSTNNLAGQGSVPGDGAAVPRAVLHLVGVGRVGDVTQTVDVMFFRPPYPKGLASSGPLRAEAVTVTGLPAGVAFPGQPGDRLPASLFSNSSASPAVDLMAQTTVSGSVAAVGTIKMDSTVQVAGEVRPGSGPQPLPDFDLAAMLARARSVSGATMLSGMVGTQTVTWFTGSLSDLTINGDLVLDNGVVWVEGSLTVRGAVRGKGIVLARDRIQVVGGAVFRADDAVALACGQELELIGSGRSGFFFQGVLYSEKSVKASDLTIVGSAICNASDPAAGNIGLKNVSLVQTPNGAGTAIGVPQLMRRADEWQKNIPNKKNASHKDQIQITPYFDPNTGKLIDRHDVHIHLPYHNYDKTWKGLTYQQVKALAKNLHDTHGAVPHNQETYDTLHAVIDRIWANPHAYVFWLSPNNVFPPAHNSRILRWQVR